MSDVVMTEAPASASDAPVAPRPLPALRGLTQAETVELLAREGGWPAFRAKQVHHWVQRRQARSYEEMANLPKDLRAWLIEHTRLGGVEAVTTQRQSADGSIKFLFKLAGGLHVESVLMPGVTADPGKMTLCVSSQVGCAVDCKFCVTGANGFFRHMTADEIVDQALQARRHLRELEGGDGEGHRTLRNIVFMGMGEPLLNTDAVLQAIRVLTESDGMDLSPRRITVSTSGILPGLEQLAAADLGVGLAVSLNAPTQEQRERIMPITRRYPLDQLMEALRRFPMKQRSRITFEYVLLAGVNDSVDHATAVAKLLRGVPSKVNIIPFNPDPALPFQRPEMEAVEAFREEVARHNLTVSVRWSKALDVSGACGQLAGQYRQKTADGKRVVLPRE